VSTEAGFNYPRPEVPRLSVSERDGRWRKVRALMARDNIDLLLALNNSSSWDQGNGNGRYLSSVGGNSASVSVIFPREGEVTVVTGPVPGIDYWKQFQLWIADIRTAFFNSTPVVIDRIKELGLASARIGIAGLSGVAREPDGLVSAGSLMSLREQLPEATFVNATALMYEARVIKSDEEVAMLKHAVVLAESALDVLARYATVGISESALYARMVGRLIEQGSEPGALLLMAVGNPLPPFVGTLPSMRRIGAAEKILVEVDAKWCGYLGHVALTLDLDEPDPISRDMAKVQYELTQACWERMRPGNSLVDLVAECEKTSAKSGYQCSLIAHSRGLGLDAPVLVNLPRDDWTANWVMENNAVFVVKPTVSTADGSRKVMWGDTVVVKSPGAQRLGSRRAPLVD
jgi:Xaa-Pro dipeptidase